MSAPVDPAVRSVRIAATLNERFGMILRTPVTPAGGTGELELRIGEAQQIYPEIWTHLDEARATLAGRGVGTTGYDTVRALEPKGSMGVSRIEIAGYSSSLTTELLGIHDEQVKTAQFNLDGHRRANLAVKALMDALPDVDWKALERAENAEIVAAGSLGPINAKSLTRWLVIGGGGLLVVYGFWYLVVREKPVDHEKIHQEQVAAREARIAELTKAADQSPCRKAAVRELTTEQRWDDPPGDERATRAHYKQACADQIAGFRTALDTTPCDDATLQKLKTALGDRDGRLDAAITAANDYHQKCTGDVR